MPIFLFQLKKLAKSDKLVKDLYVENAELIKCLEITEKREKDANKKLHHLEEKCAALQRVIAKLCPALIG